MNGALLPILLFALWTALLVLLVAAIRSGQVLTRSVQPHEFPSGTPHGSPFYWRLNRAHTNAVENLVVFAVIGLVGSLRGLDSERFVQLAWVALAARVAQTLIHVSANTAISVTARFVAFSVQLTCFGWMAALILLHPSAPALGAGVSQASCVVQIRSAAPQQAFKGKGVAHTRDEALATAWARACQALPRTEQPRCHDSAHYAGTHVVATRFVDHTLRDFEATVTVRPIAPAFEGASRGPLASGDAACARAADQACHAGGARAGCVDAGGFVLISRELKPL